MKFNKVLKLTGLVGAFTLAVGCAGPAEKTEKVVEPVQKAEPMVMPAAAAATSSTNSSYEVSRGDHLWGISGKSSVYGNPYKWPLIYKANSNIIKDADLIHPGQVLDINVNPSDAESSAAINHAKTRGSWSIGVTEASDKAYLAE